MRFLTVVRLRMKALRLRMKAHACRVDACLAAAYNAHGAMFNDTYCSQCGQSTGPRDSGFSHCDDHRRLGL